MKYLLVSAVTVTAPSYHPLVYGKKRKMENVQQHKKSKCQPASLERSINITWLPSVPRKTNFVAFYSFSLFPPILREDRFSPVLFAPLDSKNDGAGQSVAKCIYAGRKFT